MTEEKLKELEAIRAAAPGGRWLMYDGVENLEMLKSEPLHGGDGFHRAPDRIVSTEDVGAIFSNDSGAYSTLEACAFVVAAHEAVPLLIADIRRERDLANRAIETSKVTQELVTTLDSRRSDDGAEIRRLEARIAELTSHCLCLSPEAAADFGHRPKCPKYRPRLPVKPGDTVKVKVGGVVYETVIDSNGTQRFRKNTAIDWLAEDQLNRMALDYQAKKFTQRDYLEFNMALGYSVSGLSELSAFEDLEIENPLWEERKK